MMNWRNILIYKNLGQNLWHKGCFMSCRCHCRKWIFSVFVIQKIPTNQHWSYPKRLLWYGCFLILANALLRSACHTSCSMLYDLQTFKSNASTTHKGQWHNISDLSLALDLHYSQPTGEMHCGWGQGVWKPALSIGQCKLKPVSST
jgi:hypothetical protein